MCLLLHVSQLLEERLRLCGRLLRLPETAADDVRLRQVDQRDAVLHLVAHPLRQHQRGLRRGQRLPASPPHRTGMFLHRADILALQPLQRLIRLHAELQGGMSHHMQKVDLALLIHDGSAMLAGIRGNLQRPVRIIAREVGQGLPLHGSGLATAEVDVPRDLLGLCRDVQGLVRLVVLQIHVREDEHRRDDALLVPDLFEDLLRVPGLRLRALEVLRHSVANT
mmetsp:Transcript_53181/g.152392  ORF Transcript_53181/g.152392 Transcript_53181/m.152392 type:complete len:223 (-) Transcript_53181:1283-1951(-)